ncbi:hypothetical protein [Streptomyces sp. NRRL F-5555]|uniref:hypothetical protein n=1 Tax=Streptomyces sp. NRRL F-5555 TaxID=1463863 RepID=UPI00131D98C6|nr:hypothetical protein [Streptomyces sp. NRRL F-5555]
MAVTQSHRSLQGRLFVWLQRFLDVLEGVLPSVLRGGGRGQGECPIDGGSMIKETPEMSETITDHEVVEESAVESAAEAVQTSS